MSEPPANSCNNADGDSGEVRNGLQDNLEEPAACNGNHQAEAAPPAQPAACQIVVAAGGDDLQLEKVQFYTLLEHFSYS